MKLRKGDDIACPNGHLCGCVVCHIDDDRPITAEDFVADGHAEQASAWPGYRCDTCGEPVAILEGGERYRVRVAGRTGWIS